MNLSQVRQYTVGVLRGWFPNKSILDKLEQDLQGKLSFDNNQLGYKEDIDKVTRLASGIRVAQKLVDAEIDSCFCTLTSNYRPVVGEVVPFEMKSGNMEVSNGSVTIKPGQRVQVGVTLSFYDPDNTDYANIRFVLKDITNSINIDAMGTFDNENGQYEYSANMCCQYENTGYEDIQIALCVAAVHRTDVVAMSYSSMTVHEIGRKTVIDPLDHVNNAQGIEDAPVGHIISHMGTVAPKHYLICDGSEYNVADYPHLAQHIVDNFGTVNFFGGNGVDTFAVPDLRGEFLRGSGTATRNSGSGADVGTHQDPTEHKRFRTGSTKIYAHYASTSEEDIANADKTVLQGTKTASASLSSASTSTAISKFTSRPTNTSVLYCIKCEPTYFMQNQYTNYLQPTIHSLDEKVVGSWIDGKPLYQKTVSTTVSGPTDKSGTFVKKNVDITESNIETCISISAFCVSDNTTYVVPVTTNSGYILKVAREGNTLNVLCNFMTFNGLPIYITVQYTKSTDAENSFVPSMLEGHIDHMPQQGIDQVVRQNELLQEQVALLQSQVAQTSEQNTLLQEQINELSRILDEMNQEGA